MKGIVFNLFEQLVVRDHGEDAWDDLLDEADVSGAYTSLGSYDHAELVSLVRAHGERTGQAGDDVLRWFGREAIPEFERRYPELFAPHDSTRAFALTLNAIIHPEVRKLYPGAEAPTFDFDTTRPDRLDLGYRSTRGLCAFAEGLLHGAAAHFGETVEVTQPSCVHRGDDRCVLRLASVA